MGLVDDLRGCRVCLDTAPFIYYIERHTRYFPHVQPVFEAIDAHEIEALTSTITLLEVLVHPLRKGHNDIATQYREILLGASGLTTYEISHGISEQAAELRAQYSLKTPDAIQVAVGMQYDAEKLLTNDTHIQRIPEITIVTLDDYLPPN